MIFEKYQYNEVTKKCSHKSRYFIFYGLVKNCWTRLLIGITIFKRETSEKKKRTLQNWQHCLFRLAFKYKKFTAANEREKNLAIS